jgi:hypothetical protein
MGHGLGIEVEPDQRRGEHVSFVGRVLFSVLIAVSQLGALALVGLLFLGASVWLGYPGRFMQVITVIACALGGGWVGTLLVQKIWSGPNTGSLAMVPVSAAAGLILGLVLAYVLRATIPNEFFQSLLHGSLLFFGGLIGAFAGFSTVSTREAIH